MKSSGGQSGLCGTDIVRAGDSIRGEGEAGGRAADRGSSAYCAERLCDAWERLAGRAAAAGAGGGAVGRPRSTTKSMRWGGGKTGPCPRTDIVGDGDGRDAPAPSLCHGRAVRGAGGWAVEGAAAGWEIQAACDLWQWRRRTHAPRGADVGGPRGIWRHDVNEELRQKTDGVRRHPVWRADAERCRRDEPEACCHHSATPLTRIICKSDLLSHRDADTRYCASESESPVQRRPHRATRTLS